jgi:hypothetical protein
LSLETYFRAFCRLGSGDIDLIRPELRLRARLPFLRISKWPELCHQPLRCTWACGTLGVARRARPERSSCALCRLTGRLLDQQQRRLPFATRLRSGRCLRPRSPRALAGRCIRRFFDGGGSAGVGLPAARAHSSRPRSRCRVIASTAASRLPPCSLCAGHHDELRLRSRGLGLELEYCSPSTTHVRDGVSLGRSVSARCAFQAAVERSPARNRRRIRVEAVGVSAAWPRRPVQS